MKKIILCLIAVLAFVSCKMDSENKPANEVKVSFGVPIPTSSSRNLNAIVSPTVNYTLLKNDVVYIATSKVPLINVSGTYNLDLVLLTANTYKFTQFDVYDGTTLMYSLDSAKLENTEGFVVDTTGAVTPNPTKIYLHAEFGDGFESTVVPTLGSIEINSDYQPVADLTFKVSIPPGLSVSVQQKLNFTYWSSATSVHRIYLTNNDVYDMDVRRIYDPSVEGDGSVFTVGGLTNATDEFRFIIEKGSSSKYIYFSSAEVNKKDIVFSDDPSIGDTTGDITGESNGGTSGSTTTQLYSIKSGEGIGSYRFKVSAPAGEQILIEGYWIRHSEPEKKNWVSASVSDGAVFNMSTFNNSASIPSDAKFNSGGSHTHCDWYNPCIMDDFRISYKGKEVKVNHNSVGGSLLVFK